MEKPPPSLASLPGLLMWLVACQLPMGLMASMIVDASLNSLHAIHYGLMAGLIAVASILSRREAAGRRLWPALAAVAVTGIGAVIAPVPKADLIWTPYRGQ